MTVWSDQQNAIYDDIEHEAHHSVVGARAGVGKTTVIVEGVSRVPKGHRPLIVAFNTSIANEMKARVPKGPRVQTTHSFGLRQIRRAIGNDFRIEKKKSFMLISRNMEALAEADYEIRRDAVKAVGLCKGSLITDIEDIDWLVDQFDLEYGKDTKDRDWFLQCVLDLLRLSYRELKLIDFDDMLWMPLIRKWEIEQFPRVFVDELQDLNEAQIEMVLKACADGGRVMGAGDDRQCHPPGVLVQLDSRGEKFAKIEDLVEGEDVVASWNRKTQQMVGGRQIRVCGRPFKGRLHRVRVSNREVPVTPNHKFLCRWSDRTVGTHVVYLMWRAGLGFRVGWCKLFTTSGKAKIFHLAHRARMEKADRTWILKTFDDRTEAYLYESVIAARYGMPTLPFEPVHGAKHITEETIRRLFDEVSEENGERACRVLEDHGREFDLPLYPWPGEGIHTRQGRRTYFKAYASNLEPGLMSVPLPYGRNTWAGIVSVTVSDYAGPVYSLEVEEDHSYAADGVVVLNSIYQFRGASEGAMKNTVARLDALVLPLTTTYRCAKSIVEVARKYVPDFVAAETCPDGQVSHVTYGDMLGVIEPDDFLLSRTNAPLIKACFKLFKQNVPVGIKGQQIAQGLIRLVERSEATNVSRLNIWLKEWRDSEVQRRRNKKPPADTAIIEDKYDCMVELMHEARSVREVTERVKLFFVDDDDIRRVTLSTVHKAKGLERERVFLLRDTFFNTKKHKGPMPIAEENIFYVAVTRAKSHLFFVSGGVESQRSYS